MLLVLSAVITCATGAYVYYRWSQPAVTLPTTVWDSHSQMVTIRGRRLRIISQKHANLELPVFFFLHGAGGQAEQWTEQLSFFSSKGSVVAADMLGHGRSEKPKGDFYSRESFVDDLEAIFHLYKGKRNVIFAHSYGTSMAMALECRVRPEVTCMLFFGVTCAEDNVATVHPSQIPLLLKVPDLLMDAMRWWDRRGGAYSPSVNRILDKSVGEALRLKQLAWNKNTPSWVVKNMFRNVTRATQNDFAALDEDMNIIFFCGLSDHLTPVGNSERAAKACGKRCAGLYTFDHTGHQAMLEQAPLVNALALSFLVDTVGFQFPPQSRPTLTYEEVPGCANRPLGAAESGFIVPIKEFRPDDDEHSPFAFFQHHSKIQVLVDLSIGSPPYNPSDPAIKRYIKHPVVNAVPTRDDVTSFMKLMDSLRSQDPTRYVAVYSHFGINRTAFLICSYMVLKSGLAVNEAIAAFNEARPPGLLNESLIGELQLRYGKYHQITSANL